MWLSLISSPDISNAVWDVARFSHNPSKQHWDAVKRILKSAGHTRTNGLTQYPKKELDLTVCADSHFAREESDRGTVTGGAVMCPETAISCFSRTQRNVTTPSTMAESIAMSDGVTEAVFVQQMITLLVPEISGRSIRAYRDHIGAINPPNDPCRSAGLWSIDVVIISYKSLARIAVYVES